MTRLIDIEGIGKSYAQKLKEAGITTVEALLEKGGTKKGREDIAKSTGISEDLLLRWVNHADLSRIRGVGGEYSELLEASGVDSAPELAQRNPENLLQKITAVNLERNLVRRLPTLSQIQDWIEQAKQLPKVISH